MKHVSTKIGIQRKDFGVTQESKIKIDRIRSSTIGIDTFGKLPIQRVKERTILHKDSALPVQDSAPIQEKDETFMTITIVSS